MGFSGGSCSKVSACNAGDLGLIPWVGKFTWRRERLPTPIFLPEELHGQRSLVNYNPWGLKKLNMTERLSMHPINILTEMDNQFAISIFFIFKEWL